jgi:cation diffusion facilitator CzcD-associated flavoprotein CzcO
VTILGSVVIGAGQAGLSTSYHLARRGIEHVVLDGNDADLFILSAPPNV